MVRHSLLLALAACGSAPPPQTLSGSRSEPASRVRLPEELPVGDAACVGFTGARDGALVVTTRSDRFAGNGGETVVWLGFVMADGAPAPFELDHHVEATDAAAWQSERAALEAKLSAITLGPCVEVAASDEGWTLDGGARLAVEWDPSPAVNADEDLGNDQAISGRVRLASRTIATLTTGPHDGSDHEELSEVYRSEDGRAIALVIRNSDTGLSSQRVVVARTRK